MNMELIQMEDEHPQDEGDFWVKRESGELCVARWDQAEWRYADRDETSDHLVGELVDNGDPIVAWVRIP